MLLLVFGIFLWGGFHGLRRLSPNLREKIGEKGKALIALGIIAGMICMVIGYRKASYILLWQPPAFFLHINNFLMVIAALLLAMSFTKGRMRNKIRHPMLTAVKTWAVAHLLVNGDLASIFLFGGLLAWAVLSVITINKSEEWAPQDVTEDKIDWRFMFSAVVIFGAMVGVHIALGVWPFGPRT